MSHGNHNDRPVRVLFVCFDNALGHIAEAILLSLRNPRYVGCSAGVQPLPPRLRVLGYLGRRGMPVGGLQARELSELAGRRFDFVIALCERSAAGVLELDTDAVVASWSLEPLGVLLGDPRNADRALRDAFWTLNRRIAIFTSLPHGANGRDALRPMSGRSLS